VSAPAMRRLGRAGIVVAVCLLAFGAAPAWGLRGGAADLTRLARLTAPRAAPVGAYAIRRLR
jgi:hypothetical protein